MSKTCIAIVALLGVPAALVLGYFVLGSIAAVIIGTIAEVVKIKGKNSN